jgi:hypothetical protein
MILTPEYTHVKRLASVSLIMYHGTDGENLQNVLSQGLIPDPKKKVWETDPRSGFYTPSQATQGGVYLTRNLMTAMSYAGQGSTKIDIIVVVQVQTGGLLADEDDIIHILDRELPSHEYSLIHLYAGWQALLHNKIDSDFYKKETQEAVNKAQQEFVNECLDWFHRKHKNRMTPQEEQLAREILEQGFFIALTRKASYVESRSWGWDERLWKTERPESGPAEAAFKGLRDRLTRVLKRLGRPEHIREDAFNPTARIETPIRYTGRNKILAVLSEKYETGRRQVKIYYPPNKQVPQQLITDWEKAVGEWHPD